MICIFLHLYPLLQTHMPYRVRKGPNKGAWHHKYFIKGDPDKMRRIERVKIKGKATITVNSDTYSPYLLGVSPRMLIPPSVVVDTPPGTTAPSMVMMMPSMQQQGMVAAPQPEMMQMAYAANADFDQKSMSLPSVVHTTSPTSIMNSSPKSDTMTMSTMPPLATTMPPLPLAMPTVNTHEMFNIDNYVGKNYNMTEADKAADMPQLPNPSSREEEQVDEEEDLAEDMS